MLELAVCIPTISRPALLERHLKHLASFKTIELEVTVSNNDASGATEVVLKRYAKKFASFRSLTHRDKLPYWLNLDAAMRLATARYLIHLADDDLAREAELRRAVDLLERNAGLVAVFGGHDMLDMKTGEHLGARKLCKQAEFYKWDTREALMSRYWILEHPVCRSDVYQRFIYVDPPTRIFHWGSIATLLRAGAIAIVPDSLFDHYLHRERFTHERSADAEWNLEWTSEVEQAVGAMLADSPNRLNILAGQLARIYAFHAGVNAIEDRANFARFFIAKGLALDPKTFQPLARDWEARFLLPTMVHMLASRIATAGRTHDVAIEESEIAAWLKRALKEALDGRGIEVNVKCARLDDVLAKKPRATTFVVFRRYPEGRAEPFHGRCAVVEDLMQSLRLTQGNLNISLPVS